jgi:hypothetical protein
MAPERLNLHAVQQVMLAAAQLLERFEREENQRDAAPPGRE